MIEVLADQKTPMLHSGKDFMKPPGLFYLGVTKGLNTLRAFSCSVVEKFRRVGLLISWC